jgi:RNA polymerase sigma-70 factor (ECF subfamily)
MPTMSPEPRGVLEALTRYEQPLLRFAATIAGPEAARDTVQDVFLELCKEPWDKVEGHLAAWLFTVCRNKAISHRRKVARHDEVEEEHVVAEEDRSPERAFEQKESAGRVARAMEGLSARDREVVALKFAGGLSYKEIADVTQLSVSHVGVILHEALKKVREKLARDERLPLEARTA